MNSIFRVSARFRTARTRLAAGISALGLVAVSTGLVMITAPTAQAAPGDKVGVCHRDRNSSTYNHVEVSENATGEPSGHQQHLADGNAADPNFPDYILGSGGVPSEVDTDSEFEVWCLSLNPVATTGTIGDLGVTLVAGCGTYGSIVAPTNATNVTFSIDRGAFGTGLSGEYVVTAQLVNGATAFSTPLPTGWLLGTTTSTATRTVDVGDYVACVDPDPDPVFGTIGDLGVTLVAGCGTYGSIVAPTNATNVTFSIDRGAFGTGLSGEYVVTATLANGATSFSALPADWAQSSALTATRAANVGNYVACGSGGGGTPGGGTPGGGGGGTDSPSYVTPLEPRWTEPTCSTPAAVEYRSVAGVVYRTVGDAAPGERVVVRSEALGSHVFAAGTVTWWAHTFDSPRRCGGGVGGGDDPGDGGNPGVGEPGDGEPHEGGKPSPTVKGVQKFRPPTGEGDNVQPGTGGPHGVPTAVAAGLTNFSGGHGSPSTFSSPQLAQALVAGGLLLLVVGGGLGLGRRTNGAHEF